MRTWIVLLTGHDDDDPLFLQVKQARRSALEPYTGNSTARNHGQRVVQGQRLMQVDGDIFLDWLRAEGIVCSGADAGEARLHSGTPACALVPEAALWVALHMTDTAPHSKPRRRRLAPALDLVACVPAFPATLAVGVNRQGLDSALPPRAQPLAGPAAGPLRDRIELRARETSSRPADARILET